jgi:hypothetical protein
MEERTRTHSHSGGIVWPAMLIGAGIILLLQQFGYIQWSLWEILLRLWPLLIVGVGLELIIGRRSLVGSLLSLALVLMLLFGAIWLMGPGPAVSSALPAQQVTYASANSSRASVNLIPASGNLQVGAIAAVGKNALEATIRDVNGNRLQQSSAEEIRQGMYRLQLAGSENFLIPSVGTNTWMVNLTNTMPLSLNVTMGAG